MRKPGPSTRAEAALKKAVGKRPTVDPKAFADKVQPHLATITDDARRQLAEMLDMDPEDIDVDFTDIEDDITDMLYDAQLDDDKSDGALAAAIGGLAFLAFSRANQAAQDAAGVERAIWVSYHDDRVRPEHEALDGVEFSWDDDPPLSGMDSSSGDDCFPGDDYNCRCVADPATELTESDVEA